MVLPSALRGDRERVHVRRLALIGRHAGRRIALDMFDRAHALAGRQHHVAGGDVVLEIDEGLGFGGVAMRGREPEITAMRGRRALDRNRRRRRRADRSGAGGGAVGKRLGKREYAAAGARRALVLGGNVGNEGLQAPRRSASLPRDCENR